ncbi:MAG TPA: carbamoyltransferase, partial [Fibrobacteria bacterium]|nr:carbamoyltransferase [Fibrobacteria bacterium]
MRILGVSFHYHDSAAALVEDGIVVAAAEEERFTRIKHDPSFPDEAIDFCLKRAGIGIADVDAVAFYEKPLVKFERLLTQHAEHFPRSYGTFRLAMPSWLGEKLRVRKLVRKQLGYKGDVYFMEHHLSHAAGAFYPSPFEEAAILTLDGVGEWTTAGLGVGRGRRVDLTHEIRFPHSIGLLYSTITAYLGFSVNNSEYKVMGLSAYGSKDAATNPFIDKLRQVIDLKPDGSFRLDLSYFTYEYADRMPSKKLCALLGGAVRKPDEPVTDRHEAIAAAVQVVTEDAMFAMLRHLRARTGLDNVVLSGGVALNSVANGKVLAQTGFKDVWIQPAAGDAGSSIGAALYLHHAINGAPRAPSRPAMPGPRLGPSFSSDEVGVFLKQKNVVHHRLGSVDNIVSEAARLIAEGKVVGWFQGRMEWGPRALGGRSILANPCDPAMRDTLNLKVKHREAFRPFAPSVCAEDAATYFECDVPIPVPADYMLMVYPVRPEWRAKLPSVTHVDGTGRLQTVRRETEPLYHALIKAVGERTGIPMVVNTSFNVRGEPLVCTPEDAYRCMMG